MTEIVTQEMLDEVRYQQDLFGDEALDAALFLGYSRPMAVAIAKWLRAIDMGEEPRDE